MPATKAFGVAVDGSGNSYVSLKDNDIVEVHDARGDLLLSWGGQGSSEGFLSSPTGLVLDADGNVLVADSGNYRIQKFDSNGQFLMMWGWGVQDGSAAFQVCTTGCQSGLAGSGSGQFQVLRVLAVGADGSIYAGDAGNDRITRFDGSGAILDEWGSAGTGPGEFALVGNIDCDSQGNVLVADASNNRVQKFTSTGQFLMEWGSYGFGPGQFDDPTCLAVDDDDVVYVIDQGTRAQMFTTGGTYLAEFGGCCGTPGNFWIPVIMTAWGAGNLYVSDSDFGLQKFSTTRWKLFDERLTTASDTTVAPGIPVFYDSVSVSVTKNPGDTFYVSGTCGPVASWTANDNIYVNGADMGPGFSGTKGVGYPLGVPVDSVFLAVPALSVDSQIPTGTSSVAFKLADLQREVYGNGPIYLAKVPAGSVLDAPREPTRQGVLLTAASNPAVSGTRLHLVGPLGSTGTVGVFDHRGRRVRDLGVIHGEGYWDGRDRQGRRVPAGVYFLRARQGAWTGSTRVVILR